ncbi:hypothetical protein GO013_15545 [Pseudodesulfovibrio sp. JC047]|uniref:DUF1799 domain-containing protein n=1 Tax=Pseudodesulfovibrio sp. JC047 TaxID=2683199 RepID=UPI0013D5E1F5|nr:DUF1799 domain-containing protein [Pseudodesulfovibrio sp. JC047]NDV20824.1 hypothetical protein [Pseudodesulfovibrio sp. JC047]
MPGNVEAARIYRECSGQWRTAGMAGTRIDLDITAVKIVMDLEEVQDQRECLSKVRDIARIVLETKNAES